MDPEAGRSDRPGECPPESSHGPALLCGILRIDILAQEIQPEPLALCQEVFRCQSDNNSLWKLRLEGGLLGVSLEGLFIYFVHLFIDEAAEYSERILGISRAWEF